MNDKALLKKLAAYVELVAECSGKERGIYSGKFNRCRRHSFKTSGKGPAGTLQL